MPFGGIYGVIAAMERGAVPCSGVVGALSLSLTHLWRYGQVSTDPSMLGYVAGGCTGAMHTVSVTTRLRGTVSPAI